MTPPLTTRQRGAGVATATDLGKTENGQPQEPVLPNDSPSRIAGDGEIRTALRGHLTKLFPTARIVDEIQTGISRIDMAIIDEAFTALEIKSSRDSLSRLAQQASDYSRIATRAAVVTTDKHMEAVRAIVPEWWGLLLVVEMEPLMFLPAREMQLNPRIDVKQLAHLLWRDEIRVLLTANGVHRHSSKPKPELVTLLHGSAPLADVHAAILRTLRERPEWRDENGRAINRLTVSA